MSHCAHTRPLASAKLIASTLFFLLALTCAASAVCKGDEGGSGVVTAINGGETLILDDGRAVRLMGVIGPKRAGRSGLGGPGADGDHSLGSSAGQEDFAATG